ncbi:hypothetical protein AVEN_182041-1 [Araneus ventricosus]|uniref:Tc1-like transposase DDE domain-containing protein n=1 Tax=Araneus ventricosus TaxID=182803 RepID=A0A4Y2K3G2_ARAVE|nr:hypothetical protein AVEN_182041-1 [Araneus ventricosus]
MFFWSTLRPMISVDTTLNSTAYFNIVADHVHSFIVIKQENALWHHARSVSNWFEEHQSEFTLFSWLAQYPDVNPMGHLWDEVERLLRGLEAIESDQA